MTWTWQTLGEQPELWTLQTLKSTDGEWPTEQYTPWTLQTLNRHWTLRNPTDNWILDWTLPTLNNSRQTMNAVDCNPANTEHHWLCMLETVPYRPNVLKKLNWCYRLNTTCIERCRTEPTLQTERLRNWTDAIDWTLLALNAAIKLSRPYRLTLNTVYIESYWHINGTELTDITLNTT